MLSDGFERGKRGKEAVTLEGSLLACVGRTHGVSKSDHAKQNPLVMHLPSVLPRAVVASCMPQTALGSKTNVVVIRKYCSVLSE